MSAFNRRLTLEDAAAMLRAAHNDGVLNGASSAIFHHFDLMQNRIAELKSAFPENSLHTIAIKANPVVQVLRAVVAGGAGLEAASWEEVCLAIAAGCPKQRIVYDSPAKTIEEIRQALEIGICLNVDSFGELDRVAAVVKDRPPNSIIGLRVNPAVGSGSIEFTSVASRNSKFGVSLENDHERIMDAFSKFAWLSGLHVHTGSQGYRLQQLVEAVWRIAALRREIANRTRRTILHVDIGGGMPTSYRDSDRPPEPLEYRELLEQAAPELFEPEVRMITEFGRAIHANCGMAASRVEYVKPSQNLAIIHMGADFLVRPVYQPTHWQHELFVLDSQGFPKTGGKKTPVTIAGPLCFAGDIIAREILLPPVEPGDWMIIRDVGAYTLSMWSRHCSRAIPAVIGYGSQAGKTTRVLRQAETAKDVVRFWS